MSHLEVLPYEAIIECTDARIFEPIKGTLNIKSAIASSTQQGVIFSLAKQKAALPDWDASFFGIQFLSKVWKEAKDMSMKLYVLNISFLIPAS